ncbi:MAG: ATP synthase F0 subunit B [Desulfobacterales bacterium]
MKCAVCNRRMPFLSPIFAALLLLLTIDSVFAAEGGGGLTVIPDWTFLLQMANFLFLIWILNLIVYKPIRNVLQRRQQKVSGLEESITSARKDVIDKEDAFMAAIRDARAKGMKKKEALMTEATEEEKRIIAKINAKAQADLAAVREKIVAEADSARSSLMQEIDTFAEAIGHKILGRAL